MRARVVEAFDCQPVGFLSVFHLECCVAIETLVFLEHAEGHKALGGNIRFVTRAVCFLVRLSRQIQTPIEPIFALITPFLVLPFVVSRLLPVGRLLVAALLTFSQRPSFGVHLRTAYTTVGGDPFVVEVHRGSLFGCRHLILIKRFFFKRL